MEGFLEGNILSKLGFVLSAVNELVFTRHEFVGELIELIEGEAGAKQVQSSLNSSRNARSPTK